MVSRGSEPVAIVAVAQSRSYRRYPDSEVSLIMPLVNKIVETSGLDRHDIDFTIAGSCDYLAGMPFAFVVNIDAAGAWPPVYESHVEMDGAFAMFEGYVRLQVGDIDTVLVSGSGRASPGIVRHVFPLQNDPYLMAPLGLDPVAMAGIQARALLDAGKADERDFAEVVARSRLDALDNPYAQLKQDLSVHELLAEPYFCAPLRMHDLPPISDGAAALLLARGERAHELCDRPVWIEGIDHRIESHHPGLRDLTTSPSTALAGRNAGVADGAVDVAELTVNYSHEELILCEALGLDAHTRVNPSGGPLAGHPQMATGLTRVVEVARRIMTGEARRGVAHASSGSALQQNLVCTLSAEAA